MHSGGLLHLDKTIELLNYVLSTASRLIYFFKPTDPIYHDIHCCLLSSISCKVSQEADCPTEVSELLNIFEMLTGP